ncbi:hypothetical protein QUF72_08795 [Desulfobacterales bacterium HSG2]|nr:hypothetical protein [Desulfobacterales bacterium HSG2]
MTLDDILYDMFTLEDEMRAYERKYGVLTETFYEAYRAGEEPSDDSWVRDWTAWASAYQIYLRYRQQYQTAITSLRLETKNLSEIIGKTSRHEPVSIPALRQAQGPAVAALRQAQGPAVAALRQAQGPAVAELVEAKEKTQ